MLTDHAKYMREVLQAHLQTAPSNINDFMDKATTFYVDLPESCQVLIDDYANKPSPVSAHDDFILTLRGFKAIATEIYDMTDTVETSMEYIEEFDINDALLNPRPWYTELCDSDNSLAAACLVASNKRIIGNRHSAEDVYTVDDIKALRDLMDQLAQVSFGDTHVGVEILTAYAEADVETLDQAIIKIQAMCDSLITVYRNFPQIYLAFQEWGGKVLKLIEGLE